MVSKLRKKTEQNKALELLSPHLDKGHPAIEAFAEHFKKYTPLETISIITHLEWSLDSSNAFDEKRENHWRLFLFRRVVLAFMIKMEGGENILHKGSVPEILDSLDSDNACLGIAKTIDNLIIALAEEVSIDSKSLKQFYDLKKICFRLFSLKHKVDLSNYI